ncbi:MAG: TIGR01244 family phosphatase [Rhodobacteraceae bacterium]|nr:TIGR01244 family phosphatase [Paracoccaceae bacterium]
MTLDIRRLTPTYGVAPQIDPSDLPALKAAGYVMVIDNRPDGELGSALGAMIGAEAMAKAAAELGLAFVSNPAMPGSFTPELVARQRAAIEAAGGPVFAYCASGNRSTVIWELVNAGRMPTDEMLEIAASHGYAHEQFRPLIGSFAR